jgi:phage terminase small subunit
MSKLSPKQQKFVDEYCQGKSATEAARLAGYSQKRPDLSGSKLLKTKAVAAEIAKVRKAASEKTSITVAWVQEELVSTYNKAIGKCEFSAAVRALHLLGKNIGMFAETMKFDAPPGSQIQAVVNVSIGA